MSTGHDDDGDENKMKFQEGNIYVSVDSVMVGRDRRENAGT